MKYSDLLKWAEDKFNELSSELSEECMICEFVNRGDSKYANAIWNKKFNPEFQQAKHCLCVRIADERGHGRNY